MRLLIGLWLLTGAYPLWYAWRANRHTSLTHALAWAVAAWLVWALAQVAEGAGELTVVPAVRYLALALTGCAEVAVLGARRPGVAAWNFVVGGLLVVVLLPLAQGTVLGGRVQLGGDRGILLMGALLIGWMNYLPTRFAVSASLLSAACAFEMNGLLADTERYRPLVDGLLAAAPWTAWLIAKKPVSATNDVDLHWLEFRDRFGFVWGQRLREQFNRAAYHAHWPIELRWMGLHPAPDEATLAAAQTTLRALMKRFGPDDT
jgi:hypothetical protein